MKNLYQYIFEGGASGHMKHPYDYTEFTLRELKGLIRNLFSGKIEDITEKVDGMNIQATRNENGEVVFIRNKSDLNSPRGGMMLSDMITKWSDKPHVLDTFTKAASTIIKVLEKVPVSFFNPKGRRLYVNAECVVSGKTNIIPYFSEQVDFHDIWVYEFNGAEWIKVETTKDGLEKIQKACENSKAMITPNLIIQIVDQSKELMINYIKELDKIFKEVGLGEKDTIQDWKRARFHQYCKEDEKWIADNNKVEELLFKRWFDNDKSTNIRSIKDLLDSDCVEQLYSLDKKGYKHITNVCMKPIDDFFIRLGNDIIKLCKGIINSGHEEDVIRQLSQDLRDTVNSVRKQGSIEANGLLSQQLSRLEEFGENNINAVEGIVFSYKGKIMKLTGSFAPLNRILGSIKYSK